jgi:hypothetical protein
MHSSLIMQWYLEQIVININHDYKVVINIRKVIIQHNMKLNSMFECGEQATTHFQGCREDSN